MDAQWLLFGAVAFAGLLHGVSGMGFALITIAAISGTYNLSDAIILVLIPTAILNLSAWLIGGRGIIHNFCHYLVNYWQLVLLSLAGGMAGAYLLLWLNQAYLMILLALVVLWYAVTSLIGRPIVLKNTKTNMVIVGIFGGLVGGATSAMAPVMMMYLLSISDDKETIIRVANLCFFMGKVAQFVVLFGALTALSAQVWTQIGIITALAFVFMALGARINRYLPVHVFRQMILWILVLLGLRLGYFGVMGVLT
jgi:uncharacterized membrane protein YfcA